MSGCGVFGNFFPFIRFDNGVKAFKRSGRGRRTSNAADSHNASLIYATAQAAADNPPHPGDTSKVVEITINRQLFRKLFANGKTAADLRHVL